MEEGSARNFLIDFGDQIEEIDRIYRRLEDKSGRFRSGSPSAEVVESTGYWLHNLYSAYEDLFKLVASFWENHVTGGGTYHVNLLRRMRHGIDGVRPALISDETQRHLDELRAFRHVFRHAYSYGLDEERVSALLHRVLDRRQPCLADLKRFAEEVRASAGTP